MNNLGLENSEPSDFHYSPIRLAPLTFQQQSFRRRIQHGVFLDYLHPYALRLTGLLDINHVQRSFEELIRRHGALRTRITVLNGIPYQQVEEFNPRCIQIVRLSDRPLNEAEAAATRMIEESAHPICDVSTTSLFQVRLIELRESDHILSFSIHHLVSDGFSITILIRELWQVYGDMISGHSSTLTPTPMQYADYARWQQDTHESWVMSHEPYWKAQLCRAARIRFPISLHEPFTAIRSVSIAFSPSQSAAFREIASSARTVVSMVMLTLYIEAVSVWCKQKDFVVPINITGRHRSEHESMIGYFAQLLYLRIQLNNDHSFLHLLSYVSQQFTEALLHQDYGRIESQMPELMEDGIFSWFPWKLDELNGMPSPTVTASLGFKIESFPVKRPIGAISRIGVVFFQTQDGIEGSLYYQPSSFQSGSIEALVRGLQIRSEQITLHTRTYR